MNNGVKYSLVVLILFMMAFLTACDTNQPRLTLLEFDVLEVGGVMGVAIELQAQTRDVVETSLKLENTGNNVLSFSALPAETNLVALDVNPARSTLVDVGKTQEVTIRATCPEKSGVYPTQLTLLNNDVTKPKFIVALTVRCSN